MEPEATIISCNFWPENCPRMACVMAVGGWTVREYRKKFDVVAMLG